MRQRLNLAKKLSNGLRADDYDRLLASQNGACAVCLAPAIEFSKRLAIDHDHQTGIIRGLLCIRCNVALGYVKDNTTILHRLIEYLTINKQ